MVANVTCELLQKQDYKYINSFLHNAFWVLPVFEFKCKAGKYTL